MKNKILENVCLQKGQSIYGKTVFSLCRNLLSVHHASIITCTFRFFSFEKKAKISFLKKIVFKGPLIYYRGEGWCKWGEGH